MRVRELKKAVQPHLDTIKARLEKCYRDEELWSAVEAIQNLIGVGVEVQVAEEICPQLSQSESLTVRFGSAAVEHESYPKVHVK